MSKSSRDQPGGQKAGHRDLGKNIGVKSNGLKFGGGNADGWGTGGAKAGPFLYMAAARAAGAVFEARLRKLPPSPLAPPPLGSPAPFGSGSHRLFFSGTSI